MNEDCHGCALTDSREFAESFLGSARCWIPDGSASRPGPSHLDRLLLFDQNPLYANDIRLPWPWKRLYLSEKSSVSQYDQLIRLTRDYASDSGEILCLAGGQSSCHGFHNRTWQALSGNLHLSLILAPDRPIKHAPAAFLALPAVALIDVLDEIPGLKGEASLKWVNDILLGGAKIGGVLAHSRVQAGTITRVVLGIGLNVEHKPELDRDLSAPRADCLLHLAPRPEAVQLSRIFWRTLNCLSNRYRQLLDHGPGALLDIYRTRSTVLGQEVQVFASRKEKRSVVGLVTDIGPDLELYLDTQSSPLTRGNLVLKSGNWLRN